MIAFGLCFADGFSSCSLSKPICGINCKIQFANELNELPKVLVQLLASTIFIMSLQMSLNLSS